MIHKTTILSYVLYDSRPLKATELGLFQNRVLNSVLDSEKVENGEWITLHNDELHNLYSLLHNVIE